MMLGSFFSCSPSVDDLPHDDGRSGKRFQNGELAALDALCDFDFAIAGEQRNGAHFAEVHADGVVGLFQCARSQVELEIAVFRLFAPSNFFSPGILSSPAKL